MELAKAFNLTYDSVGYQLKKLKTQGREVPDFTGCRLINRPIPKPNKTFDDTYDEFCELIGKTSKKIQHPPVKKSDRKKIIVISDSHNPFVNKEKFAEFLAQEKANLLIVDGDIDDLYPLSRFPKKKDVNAVDSLKETDWFLKTLSEHFPEVELILGNHDNRVYRVFEKAGIQPDIIRAFVKTDYMSYMANQYPNVNVVSTKVNTPGVDEIFHFRIIGKDAVAGHWETYSKINLRAAENCFLWWQQWASTLNLPPIRLLLQAHTHQLGSRMVWGDKCYGETGCICQVQEYTVDGRVGYTPPQFGYWVIYQNKGITDLKESRYIPL